jgi:phosphoribosyl-AMP cyclohydrolase
MEETKFKIVKLELLKELDFSKGLIPAIIQSFQSGEVLMLAYMNEESLKRTLETGTTWFWSRSRQEYWNKGATSGHFQYVKSISMDCDGDTLLIKVEQIGAACHTGSRSCFYRDICNIEK